MTQPRPVARARVYSLGFLTALFGVTLLLALILIARVDGWWRFLFLILPAAFAVAGAVEFRIVVRSPDELR